MGNNIFCVTFSLKVSCTVRFVVCFQNIISPWLDSNSHHETIQFRFNHCPKCPLQQLKCIFLSCSSSCQLFRLYSCITEMNKMWLEDECELKTFNPAPRVLPLCQVSVYSYFFLCINIFCVTFSTKVSSTVRSIVCFKNIMSPCLDSNSQYGTL